MELRKIMSNPTFTTKINGLPTNHKIVALQQLTLLKKYSLFSDTERMYSINYKKMK